MNEAYVIIIKTPKIKKQTKVLLRVKQIRGVNNENL